MQINLAKLIGPEAAHRLGNLGLQKVAAARLRAEGHPVGEELDLRGAVQALGTKLYEKNAEYKVILDGLGALDEIARSD